MKKIFIKRMELQITENGFVNLNLEEIREEALRAENVNGYTIEIADLKYVITSNHVVIYGEMKNPPMSPTGIYRG